MVVGRRRREGRHSLPRSSARDRRDLGNIAFGVLDATGRAGRAGRAGARVRRGLPLGYDTSPTPRWSANHALRRTAATARDCAGQATGPHPRAPRNRLGSTRTTGARIRTGLYQAMRGRTNHHAGPPALDDRARGRLVGARARPDRRARHEAARDERRLRRDHGARPGLLRRQHGRSGSREGAPDSAIQRCPRLVVAPHARRIGLLARLTLPYKGRTSLALGTLLAYTLVALAPTSPSSRLTRASRAATWSA